jgi:hypothetical protein
MQYPNKHFTISAYSKLVEQNARNGLSATGNTTVQKIKHTQTSHRKELKKEVKQWHN